jgi:hypothetical protein
MKWFKQDRAWYVDSLSEWRAGSPKRRWPRSISICTSGYGPAGEVGAAEGHGRLHRRLSGVVRLVEHDGNEKGADGLVGIASGARHRAVQHVGAETRETGIDALDGLVPRRQDLRCRRAVTNDLCGRKSAGETRQPPSHVLRVWLAQARHTPCSPTSGIARQRWLSGILPTRGPFRIVFPISAVRSAA